MRRTRESRGWSRVVAEEELDATALDAQVRAIYSDRVSIAQTLAGAGLGDGTLAVADVISRFARPVVTMRVIRARRRKYDARYGPSIRCSSANTSSSIVGVRQQQVGRFECDAEATAALGDRDLGERVIQDLIEHVEYFLA